LVPNYSDPFGKLPFLSRCSPAPYSSPSLAPDIELGFPGRKRHIPALPKVRNSCTGERNTDEKVTVPVQSAKHHMDEHP